MSAALHLARPEDLEKLLTLVAGFHAEEGIDSTDEQRRTALRRAVSALAVSVFIFLIPAIMAAAPSSPADARAFLRTELVFPIQAEDAHGSTLVELPNGDLLVDWLLINFLLTSGFVFQGYKFQRRQLVLLLMIDKELPLIKG